MTNIKKRANPCGCIYTHTQVFSSEGKNISKVIEKTLKYIFIWDSS